MKKPAPLQGRSILCFVSTLTHDVADVPLSVSIRLAVSEAARRNIAPEGDSNDQPPEILYIVPCDGAMTASRYNTAMIPAAPRNSVKGNVSFASISTVKFEISGISSLHLLLSIRNIRNQLHIVLIKFIL